MAEDDTSTVWIDFNNNSPNNSIKQLSQHLSSPHVPENTTQKQQLHNNNDNKPDVPHIHSQRYGIDEIKETFPPITPCDMPQHPKLDAYKSAETINTPIICDRSRTSSVLESLPDHDSFPDIDVIVDAIINTEYATNPQHSQQIPPENNRNSNDSNDGNNGSNNHNNTPNNNNNNNNNEYNRNNNNAEKKRDNNDYGKEKHKSKQKVNGADFIYFPHKIYKNTIGGNIRITKIFTKQIIPKNVKQKYIKNVYDFLYKCIAINIHDRNFCDCGNFVILNCRFQDISGQNCDLYCVADKSNHPNSNYSYAIRDILYTKNEIASLLPKDGLLPISSKILTDDMDKISNAFNNPASVCQNVIFKTKWHNRIHIFNTKNNKQRLTFSISKNEFVDIVQKFIHNDTGNSKVLLPIVMFSDTYRVEYVQIVPLRKNIYIGISYIYENNGIKVTGIHLNKNSILLQHQLVSIEHNCKCLRHFVSEIDCLHIGNPDDDKNRYNDLKKKYNILKNVEMKNVQDENANINNNNGFLQYKNHKLQTELNAKQTEMNAKDKENTTLKMTINAMQSQINSLKLLLHPQQQLQQQQAIQMNNINATLTPVVGGSNQIMFTPSPIMNNIPRTPIINNFPRHLLQNSNSSNISTSVTTPGSFLAIHSPQSSIGTPQTNNTNISYSQPNMNNNNAMNNMNQRQVLVSISDKATQTEMVNNQKDVQNNKKNLSYNDINNDEDDANN